MSTTSYKRNPNIIRIVKYNLTLSGRNMDGEYICYEKTDDAAIQSAYKNLVWAWHPEFRIREVVIRH